MKQVFAVAPYNHGINFKMQAYDAWVKMGGRIMPSRYPWRAFHKFAYNYELPAIIKKIIYNRDVIYSKVKKSINFYEYDNKIIIRQIEKKS